MHSVDAEQRKKLISVEPMGNSLCVGIGPILAFDEGLSV